MDFIGVGRWLESQRGADAGTMNRLVAAGRPAGALLDPQGVVRSADEKLRRPLTCWKWHFKQRLALRTVNSLALTEPCGA